MTRTMPRRAIVASGAALAACSVLPARPYQQRREWPLEVHVTTAPAPPGSPVLLVREMAAAPGLDARGLRTLLPEGAERMDYWEEWAVPPSQSVVACLREWLAAGGLFTAVISPGSDLLPDLILETELLAFVGDQHAGVARATISLVLLRPARGGRGGPLLQRTVTGEAPLTGTDGPALAASLQAALLALLAQTQVVLAPFARAPAPK
jgi:cholesterol transport system auxiliary component